MAKDSAVPRLGGLVGRDALTVVAESGGKVVFTNHPIAAAVSALVGFSTTEGTGETQRNAR